MGIMQYFQHGFFLVDGKIDALRLHFIILNIGDSREIRNSEVIIVDKEQ